MKKKEDTEINQYWKKAFYVENMGQKIQKFWITSGNKFKLVEKYKYSNYLTFSALIFILTSLHFQLLNINYSWFY